MTDPQTDPLASRLPEDDRQRGRGLGLSQASPSRSVHAGENNTIQVALVGCGGRGTGAAANALSTKSGPIKLVAMADVFDDRLDDSYDELEGAARRQGRRAARTASSSASTPTRRRWTASSRATSSILATPPAFRWVQFTYAIEKGLNVFMEKPVTVDGPTTRKMLALGRGGDKKNLKVGVGLMCRHCEARAGAVRPHQGRRDRRHHRCCGPIARPARSARRCRRPKPDDISELLYQIQQVPRLPLGQRRLLQRLPDPQHRRMLLDEGRLAGQGQGARRPALPRRQHRPELRHLLGRIHLRRRHASCSSKAATSTGCHQEFASYAHGTKGSAVISTAAALAGQVPDLQGPEDRPRRTWSGPSRSPSRTPTSSSGTT